MADSSPAEETTENGGSQSSLSPARLVSFSDAVIAIAITLLAFQLVVPNIQNHGSGSELAGALGEEGSQFRIYLLTFVLIGYYWIVHHRAFRYISGHDNFLTVSNMVFLLGISLLPFGSNLFSRYPDNTTALMIYAGILALIGLSFLAISLVSQWRGLLAADADLWLVRWGRIRSVVVSGVFLLSIALAPVIGTGASEYMWLSIPVLVRVARMFRLRAA